MNLVTRSISSSLSAIKPFQAGRVIEQTRLGLLIHEIDHLREDRRSRVEKFGVIARARAHSNLRYGFPFSSVGRGTKYVALARQDEIGMDRKIEIGQARFQEIDGTAGIDCPDRRHSPAAPQSLHASTIEHRIAAMRDESSVEVSAEQADLGGHERANLGFAFATAIRLRLASSDSHAKLDTEIRMKSAYELAMERLEKKTPSVALTNEQKQQIAEIESTYKARIAEKELFLKDQIEKARAGGKYEESEALEKQLSVEIRRLQEDCETKKEKLRATFAK